MSSKKEFDSDSELLEMYHRQKNNTVLKSNSAFTVDNVSNQYYKLADDGNIQRDSFDINYNDDPRQDLHERQQYGTNKFTDPNSASLNNNTFNSPSYLTSFSNDQYYPRKPQIGYNDSRFPAIDRQGQDQRSESVNSQDDGTKKIIKWNLWWEKPESNIKLPFSYIPEYKKKVGAKIGSLEKITHKPGGGNIKVVNEKQLWKKEAKIDHIKRDYQKRGGKIQILDQKANWNGHSKIGSLENVTHKPGGGNIQILQQPFEKKGIRPRIDTGFLYKEVIVSTDYQLRPSQRNDSSSPQTNHSHSPYSSMRHHNIR